MGWYGCPDDCHRTQKLQVWVSLVTLRRTPWTPPHQNGALRHPGENIELDTSFPDRQLTKCYSWGRFIRTSPSEPAHVKSGMPQGSMLGPVPFLIFINDLPASVRSSSKLFADDCVVYREIRSTEDCQILQDDLQQLWDWERWGGMSFHQEKCSILRVHRKCSPVLFDYSHKGWFLTLENVALG